MSNWTWELEIQHLFAGCSSPVFAIWWCQDLIWVQLNMLILYDIVDCCSGKIPALHFRMLASSWSSVWLWTWPTPSTTERGSRSWLPCGYKQYMNSSLRASILARHSEDHGTVDAQAGVFGEGQSDQWICPINPHHPSLGMGCQWDATFPWC